MEQELLAAFVQWLSIKMNKSPEDAMSAIEKLSKTPEGEKQLNKLTAQFKKETEGILGGQEPTGMFREGGKLNYFVKKFQTGGVYNRGAAREAKQGLRPEEEFMAGNQNVLAKKAKAMNVEGFDKSMYNMDPNQTFDRNRYRERKREVRQMNPEWTRRQRKAYALMDNEGGGNTSKSITLDKPDLALSWTIAAPSGTRDTSGARIEDTVGRLPEPERPVVEKPSYRHWKYMQEQGEWKPVSFNQFAGKLDDMMASKDWQTGIMKGDQNSRAFQAWRAREYDRYRKDPMNYTWQNMPSDYADSKMMRANELAYKDILANRRGSGYYDPNDQSDEFTSLFKNESAVGQGYTAPVRRYWMDAETGEVADNETAARLTSQYNSQNNTTLKGNTNRHEYYTPSGEIKNTTIEGLPTTKYSTGLSRAVLAAETLPMMQLSAPGIRDGLRALYNGGRDYISRMRGNYGSAQRQLQQPSSITKGSYGNYAEMLESNPYAISDLEAAAGAAGTGAYLYFLTKENK